MARIYLTGSGASRGYHTGSGIISLPARVQIRDADSALGVYPTQARTGDKDFSGMFKTYYDDTNTINFVSDGVVYPSKLPASNKFVSGGIATPNRLNGLAATGNVRMGVSDVHAVFSDGEKISPFDENRVYIDNNVAFYQTGTDKNVLLNFQQKLNSKTIVSMNINSVSSASVYFSTGTIPGASVGGINQGVNSGIAYYNWVSKQWEVFGNLTTGSNVDICNKSAQTRANSYLACIPSALYARTFSAFDFTPFAQLQGLPTNYAGFPLATKFNASGSQELFLSGVITSPMLVEKIQLYFSASIGQWPFSQSPFSQLPQISTFIIMLERGVTNVNRTLTSINRDLHDPAGVVDDALIETQVNFSCNKSREIIWYGRVGVVNVSDSGDPGYGFSSISNFAAAQPDIYSSAELWIPVIVSGFNGADSTRPIWNRPTGSFILRNDCKIIGKTTPNASTFYDLRDELINTGLFDITNGGRNLFDIQSGRSFVKTVIGSQLSSSISTPSIQINGSTTWMQTFSSVQQVSPFVLLPTDRLLLVHVNQPHPFTDGSSLLYREDIPASIANVLASGHGELTLFGTHLRDNAPIDASSNSPLTSNSLHEAMYENVVHDQFQVEPADTFVGTYLDNIVAGSMLASKTGNPLASNTRKVQTAVSAGTAGSTGSLQRFVRLYANHNVDTPRGLNRDAEIINGELLYDSMTNFFTSSDGKPQLLAHSDYGLTDGRAKFNSVVVRYDRWGQFRDILEPLPGAAFMTLLRGKRSYERYVDIKFFSRAAKNGQGVFTTDAKQTHSQNLSTFSTSSLPFFDNTAVDRENDPDIVLASLPLVDIT